MEQENLILWLALISYVLSGVVAIFGVVFKRRPQHTVLLLLLLGLVLHALAIGLRWERLGHGPYITLFEILSSNIWSLTLAFTLAYIFIPLIRSTAAVIMPLLFVMMGWLLLTTPGEGHLPPTYDTIWLYVHIIMGKIFFGSVLVALGMSGVILLRSLVSAVSFSSLPNNSSLEELAYRFMMVGLIFDSLMLISGAIWAQDAWGRYWNWDPLETWAFLTWLILVAAIHIRITLKPSPVRAALLVLVVFVMGFLTFFGLPFISTAAHKGMV
jgi:ABC-type transport system involved in cytochrome c biogenesis permease subunit